MARFFSLTLLFGAILFCAARAGGQESSDLASLKLQAKAEIEREMNSLPSLGRHEPEEVISFTLREGKIFPVTRLSLAGAEYHSVQISGLPGWAKVWVLGSETIQTAGGNRYLQFLYRDVSVADAVDVYTEIYCNADTVNISQEAELLNDGIRSVQLVQASSAGPQAVSLYIQSQAADGPGTRQRFSGATLAELCQDHPAVIDRYVRPIFRLLRQEQAVFPVEARTGYQVLHDLWPSSPRVAAAVDAAVVNLGADAYSDREAAMRQLQSLGEPAALYLMNNPPEARGAEQTMRLEMFLAPYCPLPDDKAEKLKAEPDFLLDCLFSADPAIRRMAVIQLGRVTGKRIDLDVNLTGPALGAAVTRLRESLVHPATQP